LQKIHSYFKAGKIKNDKKNNAIVYYVNSFQDLQNVIIPHFDKYPLITQKYADFLLFKQVVNLMNDKAHLTSEGLAKILALKASMNNGLSGKLKEFFPHIVPVPRPLVENQEILDPNWLAGFTTGDGCFDVIVKKMGFSASLRFRLTQHSRDIKLINNIIKYLNCGRLEARKKLNFVEFIVIKFSDIEEKILPFFHKYPIQGIKSLDFQDFCKIALFIKNKDHLTSEGVEKIKKIKSGMNTGRNNYS